MFRKNIRRQPQPSDAKKVLQRNGFLDVFAEEDVGCGKSGEIWVKSPKKRRKSMKLKEMFKRFWTLDVHSHKGFTLVELIIVIAILAILSSVAVVGYSSYIKKANMQADMTLAAEIENALILAMYSDSLTAGDYVVIHFGKNAEYGNAKDNNANTIYAAMEAAYGSGWESALQLKWNGWGDQMPPLGAEDLQYVNSSTFNTDEETLGNLLDDVQHVVGVFGGAIGNGELDLGSSLKGYLENAGISTDKSNYQEISNATVMYVAGKMDTYLKGEGAKTAFAEDWANYENGGIPTFAMLNDAFAQTSAKFAFVEGLANYVDGVKGTSYNAMLQTESDSATDKASILTAMNTVFAAIAQNNPYEYYAYVGITFPDGYEEDPSIADVKTTRAYADAMAFAAYMQGIASSADSLMENTDLTNKNYYNDGAVLNYVTNYVSIGQAMLDMNVDTSKGAFIIYFDGLNVTCVPLDY